MKGSIRGHGDKTTYHLDGVKVTKEVFDLAFPDQPLEGCASLVGWKPLHSEALAVHPDMIQEARDDAIKKGVPTDFDANGCPVFTSRSHRREYMLRYGFFDRSGGYGDAQFGESDARFRSCGVAPDVDADVPANEVNYAAFSDEQKREFDRMMKSGGRRSR